VSLDGQMAEERAHLRSAKLLRVALALKEDEAPGPVDVGLLCPVRVVQRPNAVPQLVEQADRGERSLAGVAGPAGRDRARVRPLVSRKLEGWRRLHGQIFRLPMTQVTHPVVGTKTGVCHRRRGADSTLCNLRIRLQLAVPSVQSI